MTLSSAAIGIKRLGYHSQQAQVATAQTLLMLNRK